VTKFTAGHPAPLIALVHHRMVGTLRSTDAAFTSTDGREASTHFGIGYGCGRTGHPASAHVHQYVRLGARPDAVQPSAARRGREDSGRGGQSGRRPRGRRVRSVTMTDTAPGTIFGREPAMVLALVQAVIALVVAFGLSLAPDQIGAILAVTAVVLGLITRSRVSPV